jgi:Leucine-rich repeat (LRR) protein
MCIASLRGLQTLQLGGECDFPTEEQVPNRGLGHLQDLPALTELRLARATTDNIREITMLKALERLVLNNTNVTPECCQILRGLPNLRILELYCCDVSERKELNALQRIRGLEILER